MKLTEKEFSQLSSKYWELWNEDLQAEIDSNIEKFRKADGIFKIGGAKKGTKVKVEQTAHSFVFGAHLFNYNQLGNHDANDHYKALFSTLFNSATVAFYWNPFEPVEGKMRFEESAEDTEEFWASQEKPEYLAHWRRPPSDPCIDFCKEKGIRVHAHPMVWGNRTWHYPGWILEKLPKKYLVAMLADERNGQNILNRLSADEIAADIPEFFKEYRNAIERRIKAIAERYGDAIDSLDVVNESAYDFLGGNLVPDSVACKSIYGLMPGDYPCLAFNLVQKYFPKKALKNINDYNLKQEYVDQVMDMRRRGCKIDVMGAQMHLFNPQQCLDIATGEPNAPQQPKAVIETMKRLSQANLPIHLSEITITSPGNDEKGQAIQAVIARNLYRLWFSTEKMMGITWWNVIDGCGAPGEPSVSGILTRDGLPKLSYYALDDLINHEWHTSLVTEVGEDGSVSFRGFKGKYNLTWTDDNGNDVTKEVEI